MAANMTPDYKCMPCGNLRILERDNAGADYDCGNGRILDLYVGVVTLTSDRPAE